MTTQRGGVHLRDGGTSVVLDLDVARLPAIVHWGADLGDLTDDDLTTLLVGARAQRVSGGLDVTAPLTLIPQESDGWQGTPGLLGSRAGLAFSPALATVSVEVDGAAAVIRAVDPDAELEVLIELEVDAAGVLSQRMTLTNTGSVAYELDALTLAFPAPPAARELLDTTGRHLRERHPQRHSFTIGRHSRESRRGRPGSDNSLLMAAGRPAFGFERGTVHAVTVAWSGDSVFAAERTTTGIRSLAAGELLSPGEVTLQPGETYATPLALGSWGEGLSELSGRWHRRLRERAGHPRSPRPVTLNTWEAVYFDQQPERLLALVDLAAEVGVERFVLDDGWFRGRRDDRAGLGDWHVDANVWPEGLHPLVDAVHGHGMRFGLWVEPEMVNRDSELGRAHPDWMLQVPGRLPVEARNQQVLDLSNPEVGDYLFERLSALVTEYGIEYLKWDHNRDLVDAGSTRTRRRAVHSGVMALYALLDRLRAAHPGLEIESCASGGARVDLGILERTDRVWTSDCIDPIERLPIQRYTGLVVPYELLGAHVSGHESHSTGRALSLSLRAGVALFGHFGIEADLTTMSAAERTELRRWVDYHRANRELFHTGRAVFGDLTDDSADLRGVVADDGSRAIFTYTQVTSSEDYPPAPITFPGLNPDRRYRVTIAPLTEASAFVGQSPLEWAASGAVASGLVLGTVGLRPPVLQPQRLCVIEVAAVS